MQLIIVIQEYTCIGGGYHIIFKLVSTYLNFNHIFMYLHFILWTCFSNTVWPYFLIFFCWCCFFWAQKARFCSDYLGI